MHSRLLDLWYHNHGDVFWHACNVINEEMIAHDNGETKHANLVNVCLNLVQSIIKMIKIYGHSK